MKATTGMLREWLSLDAQGRIEEVILAKQNHNNYYMLVFSEFDPVENNVVKTKIITMLQKPSPMVGTICMHIDNKKSRVDTLWNLPADIPAPDLVEGEPVGEVGKSSVPMKDFLIHMRG